MKATATRADSPVTLTIELTTEQARHLVALIGPTNYEDTGKFVEGARKKADSDSSLMKYTRDEVKRTLGDLHYVIFDKLQDALEQENG